MEYPLPELTDQERWECVARWFNAMYRCVEFGHPIDMTHFDLKTQLERRGNPLRVLTVKEAKENFDNLFPCHVCPSYPKCIKSPYKPYYSFEILESKVGKDAVINSYPGQDLEGKEGRCKGDGLSEIDRNYTRQFYKLLPGPCDLCSRCDEH